MTKASFSCARASQNPDADYDAIIRRSDRTLEPERAKLLVREMHHRMINTLQLIIATANARLGRTSN